MRDIGLVMEMVLQSVTGQKEYVMATDEKPIVVRSKRILNVRGRVMDQAQDQTPKVMKVADIEKAKKQDYENDRSRKNVEFLRRGL